MLKNWSRITRYTVMALMLVAGSVFTSCGNDGGQDGGSEPQPEKPADTNKCTVIFDRNNGSDWAVSRESVNKGGFVTKPGTDPYLAGFLFRGWYAPGSDEEFDFGTPITSDIRLTAKWTKIPDYLKVSLTTVSGYVAEKLPANGIIEIPEGITTINVAAFRNCASLTGVTIPDTVTTIHEGAFQNCTGLTSVTIPDRVMYIGMYAFKNCVYLTSVTIPDSVTSIGMYAFNECTSLASVTIGKGVTKINEGVFYNCTNLTDVTIPKGVTEIGSGAFNGCTKLKTVNYDGTKDEWKKISRSSFTPSSSSNKKYIDGLSDITITGNDGNTWLADAYASLL